MTSLIQSHWESGIGRRAGGLAVFLLFCGLFFAESARAQDRATPREVKQQAMSALQGGDYANAIIALNQLVSWYEGSEDKNIIAELEDIYYNLGLCHLLLGQFGQAREVFDTYLKKYKNASRSRLIAIFYADSFRYEKKYPDAMRSYNQSLRTYRYEPDLEVDIYGSQVRCILAGEDWNPAEPLLLKILNLAPDRVRRNWAASILTILYLRDLRVDKVYEMVPLLLQPGSFASRSVALNMAALTAGDELFSEDSYRDALWIYRLVYPYDVLAENIQTQYENTQRRIGWLQRTPGRVRESLRAQELLSEIEAEMKALEAIPPYDSELFFRTARCYMEVRRFREGGDLFFDLYLDGTSDFIEESLYLSFLCGTKIHPLDRAFSRGEEYMKAFPGGRWYDQLSLTLGILYSAQKDWPNVLRVLGTAIEVNPKHSEMVECLHLLGYAAFMEEKFSESVDYLARMNTDYPGNEREADGAYWTGMSLMFDKKNEEATPFFDQVFTEFLYKDNNVFVEDARFRSATCDFGSSRFSQAETKLLEFVSIYPESKLLGEAYLILGDISGTFGELEEAIRRYQRCVEYPLNVELYNYSIFQAGEMMRELAATAKDPAAEKRWREAGIAHFERYVEAAREESNIPMAVYWIGSAYWDLGEVERALATYQRAIQEYGHNRADLGVDLIFEDWVGRSRNAPADVAEGAWRDLRQSLVGAIREEKWSLALRIQRILMFDPKASDQEKEALRTSLLRERNIEDASPGVLEWIIREAKTAGLRDLSEKAALKLVEDFTETDYALSARSVLAALALEDKRYEDAIRHLGVIREVYADSPEAADALLILGNLYLEQQNLDAADQAYKDLLGVKKWRHLAPAAIFGRGQISEARRKFLEATVFYEQIYVLYSGYPEWTSKAYLARARVLRRLAEFSRARETVEAFLAYRRAGLAAALPDEEFEALPDVLAAREELKQIQGRNR